MGTSSLTMVKGQHIVLSVNWFGFILQWALRQALRHTDYLTLVTIRATRAHVGWTVDIGVLALTDIAEVVGPTIRETDLIGELDDGRLGLLLSHVDDAAALRIIQRFGEFLDDVPFFVSISFETGE